VADPRSRRANPPTAAANRRRWLGLAATAAAAVLGVGLYLASPDHRLHDPNHALQQLDLLYLDQPAPGLDRLPIEQGRPVVLVFCRNACRLPALAEAHVVRSTDPDLATRYALRTGDGRIGPGYALIDAQGRVRYRTFDPGLAEHETEIGILVRGLR
jgi:hypothetical protein